LPGASESQGAVVSTNQQAAVRRSAMERTLNKAEPY
jgi:hypothetical protein